MDENLIESNSLFNNNNANNNNKKSNNNNTKLIEFIQDLKEAIQNGEFQSNAITNCNNLSNQQHHQEQQQQQQIYKPEQQYETINNVNNLSNQTFNYIINWLKQQQFQIEENKEFISSASLTQQLIQKATNDETTTTTNDTSESQISIEIRMLKNQIRTKDDEKDKLVSKYKTLQEENVDLKTKLINLKTTMSTTQTTSSTNSSNNNTNTLNYTQITTNNYNNNLKDNEIERLKRVINELVKSNEEKEKKIDDLTKQVNRFKRIQELVLHAQNQNGSIKMNKSDFDFNDTNSDNNSIPSINGDDEQQQQQQQQQHQSLVQQSSKYNNQPTKNILINSATKSASLMETSAPIKIIAPPHVQNNDKLSNSLVIASSVNQACNLISSCSLSSSLSSSSSTSSSASSPSPLQNSNLNANNLTAPLATISELISYNSLNLNSPNNSVYNVNKTNNYNTLPRQFETKQIDTERHHSTLNKQCKSSTGSSNTITNNDENSNSNSNNESEWSNIKVTLKNESCQSELIESNRMKQHQKLISKSNCTSPVHNPNSGNNKGFRNFLGKLIRTSLVNINESNYNLNNETTESMIENHINKNNPTTNNNNINNNNNNNNIFRRGGTRATASARLQNSFSISNSSLLNQQHQHDKVTNSFFSFNLDTLAFSKLNSNQCYDWLCKNGFDCYFSKNSDGTYSNKWLKNGLHLLKASKYEYEKELGIKNALHRKKLSILLQSMYDKNHINISDINLLKCIDHHWVTKWLDDIGLPQYKEIFNETKIDGLMLNILSIEDLISLNIISELHYLSIKRGIYVLRLNNFDTHCLRRRPSGDDQLDKSEVALWTNHRVMEWLRSIDLSEYAPNLRGSGVHGALMVYESRFNSTVLADLLAIPTSKTLLRRHLNTLFADLIGSQMNQIKLEAEQSSSYQPLSASNKLKQSKRIINVGGIFSHKRTKSQDSRDFFSGSISIFDNDELKMPMEFSNKTKILIKNYQDSLVGKKYNGSGNINSATLPLNSVVTFCEGNPLYGSTKKKGSSSNNKLSIMSNQESVPSSVV